MQFHSVLYFHQIFDSNFWPEGQIKYNEPKYIWSSA
jgi:hypothetical protein